MFRRDLLKKLLGNALIVSFFVGGIVLIFYQPIVNNFIAPKQLESAYRNNLDASDIKSNLERLKESENENEILKESEKKVENELFDYDSVETLKTMDRNPVINKQNVVGGVYVPSVGVNIPIMYGTSQNVLRNAIGTMKPDQVMGKGNYTLIGHNSRNPDILFAPIRRISKGDPIYITDKNKVYEYKMIQSEVVEPSRVDVMDDVEGEELVSLISCYSDDGSDRIVVQGELTNVYDYGKSSKNIKNAFDDL